MILEMHRDSVEKPDRPRTKNARGKQDRQAKKDRIQTLFLIVSLGVPLDSLRLLRL
jgi:hypothetical protein